MPGSIRELLPDVLQYKGAFCPTPGSIRAFFLWPGIIRDLYYPIPDSVREHFVLCPAFKGLM